MCCLQEFVPLVVHLLAMLWRFAVQLVGLLAVLPVERQLAMRCLLLVVLQQLDLLLALSFVHQMLLGVFEEFCGLKSAS